MQKLRNFKILIIENQDEIVRYLINKGYPAYYPFENFSFSGGWYLCHKDGEPDMFFAHKTNKECMDLTPYSFEGFKSAHEFINREISTGVISETTEVISHTLTPTMKLRWGDTIGHFRELEQCFIDNKGNEHWQVIK